MGGKAQDIEAAVNNWFKYIPRNLFKSISNQNDVAIYFADPGTPSQRALNEHSNGLLRKDGLPKEMGFNQVDQSFVSAGASVRNQIPRKYLHYQTPLEVFLKYINEWELSNLI